MMISGQDETVFCGDCGRLIPRSHSVELVGAPPRRRPYRILCRHCHAVTAFRGAYRPVTRARQDTEPD